MIDLKAGRLLLEGYAFTDQSDACYLSAGELWLLENGEALLAAAEQLEAAMRVVETARAFREQAVHGAKLTAVTELDAALAALDQLRRKR